MKSKIIISLILIFQSVFVIAQKDEKVNSTNKSQVLSPSVLHATKFDISMPLRLIYPKPIVVLENRGGLIVDPGAVNIEQVPDTQLSFDPTLQSTLGGTIPGPTVSFNALSNLSGVSPPDPAGDVGPNHYIAMTNLSFHILDKSGNSVFGPAANNTIWSGFGGFCETDNSGDPIVLYDQIADRWMLTQFTSPSHTEFFNCIAVSTTPDPTGTWYRWAILNENPQGTDLFPDYPKYGIWGDGYYLSTRDFNGGSYAGVGAYGIKRDDLISGNPTPTVVYFFVDRSTDPWRVGDGLLPADIDGFDLPPNGSPQYFVGSMDDGGPYGAPFDGLNIWEFHADFNTPANSTFTLETSLPISSYDTIFPCGGGRNCIPQQGTTNLVDIQSYRQRPLHRLAYRNFGTHESLVTNQSVEASTGIGGIRWWEIRSPDTTPVLHQEGTYAPGVNDDIHRWMGSIAMDQEGNIGLAYSASGSTMFPAIRYTGRLAGDTAGQMTLGEESIVEGTGSQTSSQRWGDYTSLNVDPIDDCTFWHVNEYYETSGGNWQIRVGAFKFDECGTPGFYLSSPESSMSVCTGDTASYDINVGSIALFNSPVTLSLSGEPGSSIVSFTPNPVTPLPGSSTLDIDVTPMASAGSYPMTLLGTAAGTDDKTLNLNLNVFDVSPSQPSLLTPSNNSINVDYQPSLNWSGSSNSQEYTVEIATDMGFTSIVFTSTLNGTTVAPTTPLDSNTIYYWRVIANNPCGDSSYSEVFNFTTAPAPGDCPDIATPMTHFSDDVEAGAGNWTHEGTGDTWQIDATNPFGGSGMAWHAVDPTTVSDQRLISPEIALPAGHHNITLQYQNHQTIEDNAPNCWDGGILEISTDGGSNWTYLDDSKMLTDNYTGTFSGTANPLTGQNFLGWCGDPQDWTKSVVDLNGYGGQNVQFRFRLGSDGSVGRDAGWVIDNIEVKSCLYPDLIFEDGFEPEE